MYYGMLNKNVEQNIQNAQAEYLKFVLTSKSRQMKEIPNTYISFTEFKKILENKKKDELLRRDELLAQEDKNPNNGNEMDEDEEEDKEDKDEVIYDRQEGADEDNDSFTKAFMKQQKEIKRILEEEKQKVIEKEEFQKKEEYKLLSMKMATEKEKEIFKKGMYFPEMREKLSQILEKNGEKQQISLLEKYGIEIPRYSFEDVSQYKIPKAQFEDNLKENVDYFGEQPIGLDNMQIGKLHFNFKTNEGQQGKFHAYSEDFINSLDILENENEFEKQRIIGLFEKHRKENIKFEKLDNKIIVENEKNEKIVLDPIKYNCHTGALESNLSEIQLQKRSQLLVPSRLDFLKQVKDKTLEFLLIIKSKAEAIKKSSTPEDYINNEGNLQKKSKLTEINQTKIVTFSPVESFMNSKFGYLNMDGFIKAFQQRMEQLEQNGTQLRIKQLQEKIKMSLNVKEDKAYESDDVEDSTEIDRKQFNRRKDAIPLDLMNDTKLLYGATYKPRKKMNYLDGLKMLIREEVNKKNLNK